MLVTFKLDDGDDAESNSRLVAMHERVEALVRACGGTLLDDSSEVMRRAALARAFGEAAAGVPPSVVLLAPAPLRTFKYCVALAAHVPCLHYNWLLHSAASIARSSSGGGGGGSGDDGRAVTEALPFLHYLLPVGALPRLSCDGDALGSETLEATTLNSATLDTTLNSSAGLSGAAPLDVRWPALLDTPPLLPLSRERAFAGQRIEVTGGDAFKKVFVAVLTEAGAKTESMLFKSDDHARKVHAIVSDYAPIQIVADQAAKHDIPIVSVDWVKNFLEKRKEKKNILMISESNRF